MPVNPYDEQTDAHGPALRLLQELGYERLTPAEAHDLRDGDTSTALLTEVLDEQLRALNEIEYKGETYAFSDASIHQAVRRLRKLPESDLLQANEKAYERLTLGVSIEQTVEGDTKSHPLQYIDWDEPENNVYHVATEPVLARRGGKTHDEERGGPTSSFTSTASRSSSSSLSAATKSCRWRRASTRCGATSSPTRSRSSSTTPSFSLPPSRARCATAPRGRSGSSGPSGGRKTRT
jgi:hypothetical protein